jgi:single-strand DNA-binding protein
MMKFNEVGNLGGEWETRWTKSGKAVATNSLAIAKRRKTDQGWEDEFTSWIRLTVWGDLAEQIAQLVPAKSRVMVEGEWWARPYQDKDGGNRVSVECTVRNIGVVARTPRRGAQTPGQVSSSQDGGAVPGGRHFGPLQPEPTGDGWNPPGGMDMSTPF